MKNDGKLSIFKEHMDEYKVLPQKEMVSLVEKAQAGDFEARDLLICSNLGLVVDIASKYEQEDKYSIDDLVMEGCLGLFKAIEKYKPDKNTSFATYATIWIKKTMVDYIKDQCTLIRIPQYLQERINSAKKWVSNELLSGNSPTANEIAIEFNIELYEASRILQETERVVSYDSTSNNDKDFSVLDIIADDEVLQDIVTQEFLKEDIRQAILNLSSLEQLVITKRFGLNGEEKMTLKEIGQLTGRSLEGIRKIEKRSIKKLELELKRYVA